MSRCALRSVVTVALLLLVASCSQPEEERSVEAFCEQLGRTTGLDDALALLDLDAIETAAAELAKLASVAPEEIRQDVQQIHQVVIELNNAVTAPSVEPADAARDVLRSRADQVAQIERAGKAVQRFAAAQCGVQLVTTTSIQSNGAEPGDVTGLD